MKQYILVLFVLSILLLSGGNSFAQWTNNVSLNTVIYDGSGEQALTKIAATTDGGCYISWFDSRGGSYAVYLQKLNALGVKQFAADGLLISNKPQNTSLVDYDLITDNANNAIVTFTDLRNGSDINPVAYKIGPTGTFLWGADGVVLTDTFNVYQANPHVVQTSDGNYVFSWIYASTPRRVYMQKLNSTGVKQWGTGITLGSGTTELYDWPWHVTSDNGGVILMWAGYTGSFLNPQGYKLYSQKFSPTGTPVWNSSRDTVYSLGRVSGFYTPRIFSDGNGGAICVWQDDRNATNTTNCYVQRINSTGTKLFPANGSVVAVNTTDALRFTPMAAYMSGTNETYVFWQQKNSTQSLIGVSGQKFDGAGTRQWTEDGKAFKPLDANSFSSLASFTFGDKIYSFYLELVTGGINGLVKGFISDRNGVITSPGGIVGLGTGLSEKLRMAACMNSAGMSMLSWQDNRTESGIFAQNMYSDGSVPVELFSFTCSSSGSSVLLNWSTVTEKNNRGFEVERKTSAGWEKAGFVQGSGTSTIRNDYSFEDKELAKGFYSYRLKQLDYDGTFSFSQIVEIEVTGVVDFVLSQNYPNPFNPSTNIRFSLPVESKVILSVYDMLGKKVADVLNETISSGVHNVNLNMNDYNLSSGIYFYKLNASSISGEKTFTSIMKLIYIK